MDRNLLDYMGETPLVKLQRIVPNDAASVYVKLEEFNPGGSIKSRIAYSMIIEAEKMGILIPGSGQTIIEPTGGNTGIGLAIVAAIKGYKTIFVIPDNFSQEKIKVLKTYGAEVILSDSSTGNDSHVRKAQEVLAKNPDYVMLDQFSNLANPQEHYAATGQEIIRALPKIDYFVAGIGSGGTISGVGKKIKKSYPHANIIAVQPHGCDVLKGKAVSHKILALALGMLPTVLDTSIVDDVISVEFDEVMDTLKTLAKKEGLLLGLSSGATVLASMKIAKTLEKKQTVVTIAPDSGKSYLDSF